MTATPSPCYRERTNGVYFTREAHRPDCNGDCKGCRPCTANHCTARRNCTWHVPDGHLTCGRCLAATRRDLRWIGDLAALLPTAALADGVESEAANLSGPSVDPEAWSWRKAAARQGVAWHVSLIEEDDEHHPARVLGTWARMVTEDYDHDMPATASLTWCGGYLDRALSRVAQDDEQDFPLLSRELRKCRQHLESVIHNDDRPDRGAPCPSCTSEVAGVGPRLRREWSHWCDDLDCERMHTDTASDDVWRCPANREHWWTHDAYENWIEERRATA